MEITPAKESPVSLRSWTTTILNQLAPNHPTGKGLPPSAPSILSWILGTRRICEEMRPNQPSWSAKARTIITEKTWSTGRRPRKGWVRYTSSTPMRPKRREKTSKFSWEGPNKSKGLIKQWEAYHQVKEASMKPNSQRRSRKGSKLSGIEGKPKGRSTESRRVKWLIGAIRQYRVTGRPIKTMS